MIPLVAIDQSKVVSSTTCWCAYMRHTKQAAVPFKCTGKEKRPAPCCHPPTVDPPYFLDHLQMMSTEALAPPIPSSPTKPGFRPTVASAWVRRFGSLPKWQTLRFYSVSYRRAVSQITKKNQKTRKSKDDCPSGGFRPVAIRCGAISTLSHYGLLAVRKGLVALPPNIFR
jgi:hypothetical protein